MNASMFLNNACTILAMDLGERITKAIKGSGREVREIARACDTSSQAIYVWMRGGVKDLRNANLFALADITGFEARWIATGEGPEQRAGGNQRESALLQAYRATDERGKMAIHRVAEAESDYSVSTDQKKDIAA